VVTIAGFAARAPGTVLSRGRVTITTSCGDDDTVRVTVCDAGPGISAELVNNLFEPFVTTKDDGLGMGLTISRSIVEAHGGKLVAEADAAGGALVSFTLGRERREEKAEQ